MERQDGRTPDQLRPVRVQRRYLKHAHGSCMLDLGDTRVLCAASIVEGVWSVAQRQGTRMGHRRVCAAPCLDAYPLTS